MRLRRMIVNKKILAAVLFAGASLLTGSQAHAQAATGQQPAASGQASKPVTDQDIALLRADIRSQRKQLIAANLKLTDTEATKFWPIYDQYTSELVKINDEKYALIKLYAENWGTMTDQQASGYITRWLNVDMQVSQLRAKYAPIVGQVLPGKTAATFFQLDRRLQMMIDLQLASQIPLVQSMQQ